MNLKISWLWLAFLPLLLASHMRKTLLILFFMLTIHEGAHMLVAHCFHYPIDKVILYPFGLSAQMRCIGMGSIWKELLIIIAGPATHVLFPYVFSFMAAANLISQPYMNYLCQLNTSILVFNLLPIFPLDGGRIVQSLFHLVFRYTSAQILTYLTGIINLFLLWHYRIIQTASAYLVMSFLLLQILMCWKQLAYERMAFYHYRMLHPAKGFLRMNRKNDLFRAYTNVIETKNGWILEDEWLKTVFHETPKANRLQIML